MWNEGRFLGGVVVVGSFFKLFDYFDLICIYDLDFSGNKLLMDFCGEFDCGGGVVVLYVKYMGNLLIVSDIFIDNWVEDKISGVIYVEVVCLYLDVEILNCEFFCNWVMELISIFVLYFFDLF